MPYLDVTSMRADLFTGFWGISCGITRLQVTRITDMG
jgi:hypothetical protein